MSSKKDKDISISIFPLPDKNSLFVGLNGRGSLKLTGVIRLTAPKDTISKRTIQELHIVFEGITHTYIITQESLECKEEETLCSSRTNITLFHPKGVGGVSMPARPARFEEPVAVRAGDTDYEFEIDLQQNLAPSCLITSDALTKFNHSTLKKNERYVGETYYRLVVRFTENLLTKGEFTSVTREKEFLMAPMTMWDTPTLMDLRHPRPYLWWSVDNHPNTYTNLLDYQIEVDRQVFGPGDIILFSFQIVPKVEGIFIYKVSFTMIERCVVAAYFKGKRHQITNEKRIIHWAADDDFADFSIKQMHPLKIPQSPDVNPTGIWGKQEIVEISHFAYISVKFIRSNDARFLEARLMTSKAPTLEGKLVELGIPCLEARMPEVAMRVSSVNAQSAELVLGNTSLLPSMRDSQAQQFLLFQQQQQQQQQQHQQQQILRQQAFQLQQHQIMAQQQFSQKSQWDNLNSASGSSNQSLSRPVIPQQYKPEFDTNSNESKSSAKSPTIEISDDLKAAILKRRKSTSNKVERWLQQVDSIESSPTSPPPNLRSETTSPIESVAKMSLRSPIETNQSAVDAFSRPTDHLKSPTTPPPRSPSGNLFRKESPLHMTEPSSLLNPNVGRRKISEPTINNPPSRKPSDATYTYSPPVAINSPETVSKIEPISERASESTLVSQQNSSFFNNFGTVPEIPLPIMSDSDTLDDEKEDSKLKPLDTQASGQINVAHKIISRGRGPSLSQISSVSSMQDPGVLVEGIKMINSRKELTPKSTTSNNHTADVSSEDVMFLLNQLPLEDEEMDLTNNYMFTEIQNVDLENKDSKPSFLKPAPRNVKVGTSLKKEGGYMSDSPYGKSTAPMVNAGYASDVGYKAVKTTTSQNIPTVPIDAESKADRLRQFLRDAATIAKAETSMSPILPELPPPPPQFSRTSTPYRQNSVSRGKSVRVPLKDHTTTTSAFEKSDSEDVEMQYSKSAPATTYMQNLAYKTPPMSTMDVIGDYLPLGSPLPTHLIPQRTHSEGRKSPKRSQINAMVNDPLLLNYTGLIPKRQNSLKDSRKNSPSEVEKN